MTDDITPSKWSGRLAAALGFIFLLAVIYRPRPFWPKSIEEAALAGILFELLLLIGWDLQHPSQLHEFPVELALADHIWSCAKGGIAAATAFWAVNGTQEKFESREHGEFPRV